MGTKAGGNNKNPASSTSGPGRLYRSEKDRVLGGVCGGLGHYFGIDPTLIRLVFAIMIIFGGSGVLLYIILWLVIPSEKSRYVINEDSIKKNAGEIKEKAQVWAEGLRDERRTNSRVWVGVIILLIGLMFLFNNFSIIPHLDFGKLWPLLLIVIGFLILAGRR